MASEDLSRHKKLQIEDIGEYRIGMVVSEWNDEITTALADGCRNTLLELGVKEDHILEHRVPGTFELPVGAKLMMRHDSLDAIVCIGCVIRGETSHNEYISHSVALALQQLSLASGLPCIFGVLTPDNERQAEERAGGEKGNKGVEAAYTAVRMAQLKRGRSEGGKKIGFA